MGMNKHQNLCCLKGISLSISSGNWGSAKLGTGKDRFTWAASQERFKGKSVLSTAGTTVLHPAWKWGQKTKNTVTTGKSNKRALAEWNHLVTVPRGKENSFNIFQKLNLIFAFQIQRGWIQELVFPQKILLLVGKQDQIFLHRFLMMLLNNPACVLQTKTLSAEQLIWLCCGFIAFSFPQFRVTGLVLSTGCSLPGPAALHLPKNFSVVTTTLFVENSF